MNTPACISPLLHHWPLPNPVDGAALVSCAFDPNRLDDQAFAQAGVELGPHLVRAVAKRRTEYLAGRLCARQALHTLGGPRVVLATDADRAPVWPAGFCGAITHGHGWAAAIAAPLDACAGLGLDAEDLIETERAVRLQGEILTPTEIARLDNRDPSLAITLTFSLKESLFKALFPLVRQRFYFEHAELLEWGDGQARIRLLTDLSPDWQSGRELVGQYSVENGRLLSLITLSRA